MKSCIIQLGALVALALASSQSEAAYKHLNQYLVEKVDRQDVSSNMKAAIEWLKEQEVAKRSVFQMRNPVPDLKKFTPLQQLIDSPKCDGSDYEIMKANEAVVSLHRLFDDKKVIRRVDNVMLQIFKDHSQKCQNVYPAVYKAKKEQFDVTTMNLIEKLGDDVIDFVKRKRLIQSMIEADNLFYFFIRRSSEENLHVDRNVYYNVIIEVAKDDPNVKFTREVPDEQTGKFVLRRDKIRQLVVDYLVKPCKQYEAFFGPDLFIPARFDTRIYYKLDDSELDYYIKWAYFKICEAITDNEATVHNDVIKSALEI